MEFIDKHMGFPTLRPVAVDPVQHGIGDSHKTGLLQIFAEGVNIVGGNPVLRVHIGFVGKDIQRAGGIQLHGQRQPPCFWLRLFQQLLPHSTEGGYTTGLLLLPEHLGDTPVNDGLLVRPNAVRVHLFQQGHDELGLERHGTTFTIAVFHVHSVDPIGAAHGIADHRAAQCLDQRRVFSLRVQNDDVIVGGQGDGNDQQLGKEGFAGTGNAQKHHGLVQQVVHIAENQIVGDRVLPKIDATRLLNLLHLEGHEHRKAFRGQSAESIDFSSADGQSSIQSIQLLIPQHRHLAHMVCRNLQQRIGVSIQFRLGIRKMNNGQHRQHHSLVTGGQIGHIFLGLPALLLHIVGHDGGEVIVGILPTLPVGDIGFHPQHLPLHLPHRFIGGNGDDVNGQHHAPALVGQLRHKLVGDERGIVLEVDYSGILAAQHQIVTVLLNGIRADVIPEVMALAHHVLHIEVEVHFLVAAVEIVEKPQLFRGVQFCHSGSQGGEPGGQLRTGASEISAGILNRFLAYRNRHILLLYNAAAAGAFLHNDIVVFLTVAIQSIASQLHENCAFKILPVQMVVVQGDFRGGAAIQAVDERRIGQEQILLGFLRGNHVIDVGELEGLGKTVSHKEDAVAPNPPNGNHILHPARNTVAFPILPQYLLNCFHAVFLPPFRVLRWCLS